MSITQSKIILQNLIHNKDFTTKALPHLKEEYFQLPEEAIVFKHINNFIIKYSAQPTSEAIAISIANDESFNEKTAENIEKVIDDIKEYKQHDKEWLIEETEKFCKEVAVNNALIKSINIVEGVDKSLDKGSVPQIMTDALSVCFESHLGHDHIEDANERYDYYINKEDKVPFDLDYMNKITKGGVSPDRVNIIIGMTHSGKSALMCHMAANNLRDGKNVLYVSMEMAEVEISKRIDCNLLDISMADIDSIPRKTFTKKIENLKNKTTGKLIVKEYPIRCAGMLQIQSLLDELKLKQRFIPDIIYIDYLNICKSDRLKESESNMYLYTKSISTEMSEFARKRKLPIVTATQFNRGAGGSSDPGMEDISESYAAVFSADFVIALIVNEELRARNQVLIKQCKNRYDDKGKIEKFVIGFDRNKMRFYDVDEPTKGIGVGDETEKAYDDFTKEIKTAEKAKEKGIIF